MHSARRGVAGLAPVADRGWVSGAEPFCRQCQRQSPVRRSVARQTQSQESWGGCGLAGPGNAGFTSRTKIPVLQVSRSPAGRNRVRAARPCRCRREGARAARRRCRDVRGSGKRRRPNPPRELRAGPAWLKSPCLQYRNEVAAAQDPALPHAKSTRTRTVASSKNPHERHRPQCERRSAARTGHGAAGLRPAGVRGAGEDLVSVRRHVWQAGDRGAHGTSCRCSRSSARSRWMPRCARNCSASAPPPSTGCCSPRNASCRCAVAPTPSPPPACCIPRRAAIAREFGISSGTSSRMLPYDDLTDASIGFPVSARLAAAFSSRSRFLMAVSANASTLPHGQSRVRQRRRPVERDWASRSTTDGTRRRCRSWWCARPRRTPPAKSPSRPCMNSRMPSPR